MKSLIFILTLCTATTGYIFGQPASHVDTLDEKPASRPHILYFEAMGRAGYYNLGYGYSFYQRNKHELNVLVGLSYLNGDTRARLTFVPVGIFYRFGHRFKFEAGFSVTPRINWQRFKGEYYDLGYAHARVLSHDVNLIPSVGFAYATRNQMFELGARYTPYINPTMVENSIGYVFGAFFHYRLKGKRGKTTTNTSYAK